MSSWENDLEAAAEAELRRRAVPPFRPDPDLIGSLYGPSALEVIRWRWRRRRARRYVRVAELAYRRLPNARNRDALDRADLNLRRVDNTRP